MAIAAASNAGPRLAEVAGRTNWREAWRRELFFLGIVLSRSFEHFLSIVPLRAKIGVFLLFKCPDHSIERGIEDDGRTAQGLQFRDFGVALRGRWKQLAAMEIHRKPGIFEQMPGEHQYYGFPWLDETLFQQFS